MSDTDILKDYNVLKTCGDEELARDALAVLNEALRSGKLSVAGRDLTEDTLVKMLKAIGKFGTLKGLLPLRTSSLPIIEVDLSGNVLFTPPAGLPEPLSSARSTLKRRAETVQLVVQFVRVSTDCKTVRLMDCGLTGTTHDKDDAVEQDIMRLVKKFGAGKQSKYMREVNLAGNKFGAEFARRIIEGAYWERVRHPDKDHPPRLFLDLSRNRINGCDQLLEELRAGRTAGGPIDVASTDDPKEVCDKALIKVDLSGQRDRSMSPVTDSVRRSPAEQLRSDRYESRSPPRGGRHQSPARSHSKRRGASSDRAPRSHSRGAGRRGGGDDHDNRGCASGAGGGRGRGRSTDSRSRSHSQRGGRHRGRRRARLSSDSRSGHGRRGSSRGRRRRR